ncbi:MAG: Gfo/Idh/MocA family oxidoreductase [Verrucomicrobia bacterium]|nr:Gfo/Idh/MocA family oxidoreductase [Verrucomicrobiota bacterium]
MNTRPFSASRGLLPNHAFGRRAFLRNVAAGVSVLTVAPGSVLGRGGQSAPSQQPALAGVGIGGVGFGQLQELEKAGFRIVALCDVDDAYAQKAYDKWPQARRYRDFRELLQTEADRIDAVYCGTPDHTHALIALAALRRKKHVCCVKPLTRTVHEGRVLLAAAKASGTATQMTASPHSTEQPRRLEEWLAAGLIGAVREVHIWSNRPVWPQGMLRPPGEDAVPRTLDWKLWIGPAPQRPFKDKWPADHYALQQLKADVDWIRQYNGVYHPFNFRGWWDFGTGALGDMGCHHFNAVVRALRLGPPRAIEAAATKVTSESAPLASIVAYDFAAREGHPPVRVVWHDGGLRPPQPAEWSDPLPEEGAIYFGDEGKLLYSWQGPKLLDPRVAARATDIPRTLPRRPGTWVEWCQACTGGEPASCAFDWAVPLTEIVLLGNIAIRTGKRLEWDSAAMAFKNHEPANAFLREPYHNGWSLETI